MSAAGDDLEQRAQSGNVEAQIALARHFEAQDKTSLARGWFARAAKQGSAAAVRSLAINLLTKQPIMEPDGVNMIRAAAAQGDGEAAHVCGMLAAQDTRLEDRWSIARECLVRSAGMGFALARAELDLFGSRLDAGEIEALTGALPVKSVFGSPRISIIEGCAGAEICDWLVERARPRVARALVYDPAVGGGRVEQARSNSAVTFDIAQSDIVLMLLRARIAAIAALAPEGLETSAILHYAPGEQFEPHFDFLDPDVPGYARDVAERGQRVATFLLYLNDDYEGGETAFPELGWSYKGRKGDALLFWNVDPKGAPDGKTSHAGLPPTKGEKWLLSQWLRQRLHG